MTEFLPKNIIFTGVAGTGKTYRLQKIAQDYTEIRTLVTAEELLTTLVAPLSWREVICLVFLDEREKGKNLLKVPEIMENKFLKGKASLYKIKRPPNTVWGTLQQFSNPNSQNVFTKNRASQAFFDKDDSSNWFLLPECLPLLTELQQKLTDYHTATAPENVNDNVLKTERFSLVSFHQAYGYEEFVEGIRPVPTDSGHLNYQVKAGAFLELCKRANNDPNHRYAMLIDEINRANVSRVFGELMSLIEPSKREGKTSAMRVNLAYSGKPFSVPSNIDIYATMNTQDHSLTPLDMAFRRRFHFVECLPDYSLLGQIVVGDEVIDLAKLLMTLNDEICQILGKDSEVGHSFLMNINSLEELAQAFEQAIIPQVAQACQNNGAILQQIFGKNIINVMQNKSQFYPMQNQGFSVNKAVLFEVKTYQEIYKS